MAGAVFDLRVTVPADPQYAEMVRGVVVHGARHAGCLEADASAFGGKVEEAIRDMLAAAGPDASVSIAVRRVRGPMEVVVSSDRGARTLAVDIVDI